MLILISGLYPYDGYISADVMCANIELGLDRMTTLNL